MTIDRIKSSKDALRKSTNLKNVWSGETVLSQRILIYCAELLEQIAAKKKRPRSKWQSFLSAQMRQGVSIKQAAVNWRNRKP